MSVLDVCPAAPDWQLDWAALRAAYAWVDRLHSCPQDSTYHAEGDVGVHTRMACELLLGSPAFRALPRADQRIVFGAVLLHDVAKPLVTRTVDGRVSSRGHSTRGESVARQLLWRQAVPFAEREAICALVRNHQLPFFLLDRDDSQRAAFAVSHSVRCDWLSLVAWADGAGRRCVDQQRILDNVELFRTYCEEHGCLDRPRAFPSDHARFEYFRAPQRDPDYAAHDDTRCEVTVMAGLPGAGKNHWIAHHAADLPVVSLDELRGELGVDPSGPQGRVVDAGRARARELLRARRSFVWNATNLSRSLRDQLIALFAGYRARVRIVYVERPEPVIRAANRARVEPVPERVMDNLLGRWTVPSAIEAHDVLYAVESGHSHR